MSAQTTRSKKITWVAEGVGYRTLADGTRSYCIDYFDAGRKRVRTFKDPETGRPMKREKDVRAAKARVTVRDADGVALVRSDVHLAELAAEWLERQVDVADSTLKLHRLNLENHVLPGYGRTKVSSFNEQHYRDLILALKREGKAGSTIRNILTPLRQVIDEAVTRRILPSNPWERVPKKERPRVEEAVKRILTADEIELLLEGARPKKPSGSLRLYCFLTLLVYSGLRAGEALGLTWKQVDLEAGVIRVRHQLDKETGGLTSRLKTRASKRDVPIAPRLRKALLEWQMQTQPGDFVFSTATGTAWSHRNSLRAVVDLALVLGINEEPEDPERPNLDQHSLRHVFASAMIRVTKGDAERVAALTGHDDIQTLLRTYSHEFEAVRGGTSVAQEAQLIEAAFGV